MTVSGRLCCSSAARSALHLLEECVVDFVQQLRHMFRGDALLQATRNWHSQGTYLHVVAFCKQPDADDPYGAVAFRRRRRVRQLED